VPVDEAPLPERLEADRDLLAAIMNSPEPLSEIKMPDEFVCTDGPNDHDHPSPSHVEHFDDTLTKEQIAMLVDYYNEQSGRADSDEPSR
jgi:hypothetical protein